MFVDTARKSRTFPVDFVFFFFKYVIIVHALIHVIANKGLNYLINILIIAHVMTRVID